MRKGSRVKNWKSGQYGTVTKGSVYINADGFPRIGVRLDNGQYRQWNPYIYLYEV